MKPVTLITGTRKGIGRSLAEHYVGRGHEVIGCSRRAIDWTAANYTHYEVDVTSEAQCTDLFAAIRARWQRLDHLINNAGIAVMNHALLTPMSTAREVLETNVLGTFLFCRESARMMQRQRFGRIVNVSSIAVPFALEGEAIYAASKAAVVSLTSVLARELAPFGITVNAIGPTPIDTDLIRNVSQEKLQALLKRQALPRLATMEDISNVTDFFLRPESGFVTGQTLYLGGA